MEEQRKRMEEEQRKLEMELEERMREEEEQRRSIYIFIYLIEFSLNFLINFLRTIRRTSKTSWSPWTVRFYEKLKIFLFSYIFIYIGKFWENSDNFHEFFYNFIN